jgi:hypothetical protein
MINENACEIFRNDVMEEKYFQECEINFIIQTKSSQKSKKSRKNNERKYQKFACSKNNLEVTW